MKKTLLLTHEYFPFHGGIANYLHGYFRFLPEVEIISDQAVLPTDKNIHHHSLIGIIPPRWHRGLRVVQKFVKEHSIECIFTPHVFPLGQIAWEIKKKTAIPYVISLHGLDINLALLKDRQKAIEILQNAKHIITNSEYVKKILQPLNLTTPITVLTPNFNRPDSADKNATIVSRYADSDVLLTVARLVKRKNHATIIRAIAKLADPKIRYVIIGQGPEEENLKKIAYEECGLTEKQVEILTNVSHEDLLTYFQIAKAFILPTINLGPDIEGYGIVYLEAAHYSLPIIAARGTAAEDFIVDGESGLLVEGTNVAAIQQAIKNIFEQAELAQQLGQGARKTLEQLPTTAEKVNLLRTILS